MKKPSAGERLGLMQMAGADLRLSPFTTPMGLAQFNCGSVVLWSAHQPAHSSASVKHGNRGRTYPVTFPTIDRIGKSLSGAAISLSAMLSDKDDSRICGHLALVD